MIIIFKINKEHEMFKTITAAKKMSDGANAENFP